jgi:hypothetical protein
MNVQPPARMGKTAFLDWVQGRGRACPAMVVPF